MNVTLKKRLITKEEPYQILFVCLGNICRSPTGEGVMQHIVNQAGLSSYFLIDSAGTSAWHTGEPANSKSKAVAAEYGVALLSRARQFQAHDLDQFDLIFAMDSSNLRDMLALATTEEHKNKMMLLREFDSEPSDKQVPDPYYGGLSGFHDVFRMVERCCNNILETLKPMIKA
jgi:protein-tyrosine phosphatase